jgi:hypothetical protein
MIMGDGPCRHCADEDQTMPVDAEFLLTIFLHMKRGALLKCKDALEEDIRGNCDDCGGERSERLHELVLMALAAKNARKFSPSFHITERPVCSFR